MRTSSSWPCASSYVSSSESSILPFLFVSMIAKRRSASLWVFAMAKPRNTQV